MINSLVSVIICVYNDNPTYLKKSLDSLLLQSYKNIEIILLNDGSTNNDTVSLLRNYGKNANVIYAENKINKGLAYSLNKCVDLAHGEFIARMDGDDICEVDRIKKQVEFLNNHNEIDFVSCNAKVIDENDNIVGAIKSIQKPNFIDVIKNVCFVHPAVIFRKNIFDKLKYESNDITKNGRCEDYDFWCKLYYNNYHGYNLDEYLLKYRETKLNLKKRTKKSRIYLLKCKKLWINKTKKQLHLSKNVLLKDKILILLPQFIVNYMHKKKIRRNYEK